MVSFWKASFSSPFGGCGMQLHSGWRTDPEASSLFPNTQISVVRLRAFKEQPFSRSFWHCGAFLVEQSVCWVSLTWTYPMLIPRASLFGDLQFPTTSALVHLREVSEGSRATYVSLVLENVKFTHNSLSYRPVFFRLLKWRLLRDFWHFVKIKRPLSPLRFLDAESSSSNLVSSVTGVEYTCAAVTPHSLPIRQMSQVNPRWRAWWGNAFYLFYHFYTKCTFCSMINKQGCWFFRSGFL